MADKISKNVLSFTFLVNFLLGISAIGDHYWQHIDPLGTYTSPDLLLWAWISEFIIVLDIAVFFLIQRFPKPMILLINTSLALIGLIGMIIAIGCLVGIENPLYIMKLGWTPIILTFIDIGNGFIANMVAEPDLVKLKFQRPKRK